MLKSLDHLVGHFNPARDHNGRDFSKLVGSRDPKVKLGNRIIYILSSTLKPVLRGGSAGYLVGTLLHLMDAFDPNLHQFSPKEYSFFLSGCTSAGDLIDFTQYQLRGFSRIIKAYKNYRKESKVT